MANLLKWQLWPVQKDPSWWLRVDILSCIAYSLLVLWAFVFAGGNRPRAISAAMAALGILVFAASPWTETVTGGGPLRHFVNNRTASPFPFLPWAGYAFLGAALGGLMSIPEKGLTLTVRGLVAMFALGTAVAWGGPVLSKIYPWDVWFLTNAGERIWRVAAIALVLVGVEQFGSRKGFAMRNPVTWVLEFYGTQSLSVFYFHIMLLCGWTFTIRSTASCGSGRWATCITSAAGAFWGVTLGIIAATGVLVRAWDVVDPAALEKKAKPRRRLDLLGSSHSLYCLSFPPPFSSSGIRFSQTVRQRQDADKENENVPAAASAPSTGTAASPSRHDRMPLLVTLSTSLDFIPSACG